MLKTGILLTLFLAIVSVSLANTDSNALTTEFTGDFAKRYQQLVNQYFPNLLKDSNWKLYAYSAAGAAEVAGALIDGLRYLRLQKDKIHPFDLNDLEGLMLKRMGFLITGASLGGAGGYYSTGSPLDAAIGAGLGALAGKIYFETTYEKDILRMKRLLKQDLLSGIIPLDMVKSQALEDISVDLYRVLSSPDMVSDISRTLPAF